MLAKYLSSAPTWVLYLGPPIMALEPNYSEGRQAGRLVTVLLFPEALAVILNPLCSVSGNCSSSDTY